MSPREPWLLTDQPLGIWPLKCSLCDQWFCYIPWSNELYHINFLRLLCTNINTDQVYLVSLLRDLSFWYCGQLLAGRCLHDHIPHKSLRPWDCSGLLWAETLHIIRPQSLLPKRKHVLCGLGREETREPMLDLSALRQYISFSSCFCSVINLSHEHKLLLKCKSPSSKLREAVGHLTTRYVKLGQTWN